MLATADAIAQRAAESMIVSLFEQYQRPIFAYLLRLVGEREWAEELTQETFLAALRAADQLPGIANHRAWLYRIATNAAFNALKRRRRVAYSLSALLCSPLCLLTAAASANGASPHS